MATPEYYLEDSGSPSTVIGLLKCEVAPETTTKRGAVYQAPYSSTPFELTDSEYQQGRLSIKVWCRLVTFADSLAFRDNVLTVAKSIKYVHENYERREVLSLASYTRQPIQGGYLLTLTFNMLDEDWVTQVTHPSALNPLYPSDTLYPDDDVYPEG